MYCVEISSGDVVNPQIFDQACEVTAAPVNTFGSGVGVKELPMGHGQHGLLCLHPQAGGCL